MKKLIAILMALVMVLALAACGKDENTNNPGQTVTPGDNTQTNTTVEQNSFSVALNGVTIALHAPAAAIVEALGEPVQYNESTSCAFDGLDKTYVYSSFAFTTYPVNGVDYINSLWFLDDLVENDKGITIGSSFADVQAAYGADCYNGVDTYTVTQGHGKLQIKVEGEIVTDILYSATFE